MPRIWKLNSRSLSPRGPVVALTGILLLAATAACFGGDPEDAEVAKRKVLDGQSREYQPSPPGQHPDQAEKEAREQQERNGSRSAPADFVGPPDEAAKHQATDRAAEMLQEERQRLLESHDWEKQLEIAGPARDDLQLALAAPDKPFQFGPSYHLFLALRNNASAGRRVEAMPVCGSLGRCDTLVLRIVSDNGTELVVANAYNDTGRRKHEHAALSIDGQGLAKDLLDLTEQAACSDKLFELLKASQSLRITAEVPGPGLRSNAIQVRLVPVAPPTEQPAPAQPSQTPTAGASQNEGRK